ncbi:Phosphoglycerate kinase [Methanococcus vannielii SB]|uniref:Phosphoglycerate kinase n=1 Tax=Methanococcus vannielii (strain ATCC 35089 / DSM 1224 / JCM 13029 / OCM 148 / SB) TaxID=406327 RepID=A6UQH9_METVS|nr:phosphoglycerate kinase [Methanococcus vannielii]ABR54751.1 Phosphoglycerate kinase [Methanococcus vannielii SB]
MFLTLDDFNLEGKTVALRVDINSPIDVNNGAILDDTRIKACYNTIKDLSNKGAKVVILAHQSRPGKKDFTTLESHAKKLSEVLGIEVGYVDGLLGSTVRESILGMDNGEVILLENVRLLSEEVLSEWKSWDKITPEKQAKTIMVKKLHPFFDYFVNDAFAAAHRAQPSLVGFSYYMPMLCGRVMEKELFTLTKVIKNPDRPCVFALGGAKADDSIEVIKNVLEKQTADQVITSGIVANIFLIAKGFKLGPNEKLIDDMGYTGQVTIAKELIEKYGEKIVIPIDAALNIEGERKETELNLNNEVSHPIHDLGQKTIESYWEILKNAKTIVANGPAGVFENKNFLKGTEEILKATASSKGFSVIGGGHLSAAAEVVGISGNVGHISTGGGACIEFLAGKRLPVIEMLLESYEKHKA